MSVYIHDTAEVSCKAQIGDGTKIWNQVQIREQVIIGNNCTLSKNVYVDQGVHIGNWVKIQNNVNVYCGVTIEDEVFLGPSMTFTNDLFPRSCSNDWKIYETKIKKGASIGANAVIVCGTIIGQYAMIGAGSVVTKNVPDFALVVGNPAKRIGWVCRCGQRLSKNNKCLSCGKNYVLLKDNILKEQRDE